MVAEGGRGIGKKGEGFGRRKKGWRGRRRVVKEALHREEIGGRSWIVKWREGSGRWEMSG